MSGFLDHCRGKFEDGKARSSQAYATKVVKRIMASFEVPVSFSEATDMEFGFNWFNTEYPTFPVLLDGHNTKVDVAQLFKAITKSPAWVLLMDHLESIDNHTGGIVIPAYAEGLFVAHNWWAIPEVPGFTRLVRKASRDSDGLIFEPLESFLMGVKAAGWAP